MMIYRRIFLGIFVFVLGLHAAPGQYYTVERQSREAVIIRFHFPDPEFTAGDRNSNFVRIELPGLESQYVNNRPLLPLFSYSLVAPPGKVRWKIISSETRFFPRLRPVLYLSGSAEKAPPAPDRHFSVYPKQIIQLEEIGIFRDYRILGLRVFPVQATADGIKFYKTVRVKFQFPKSIVASRGRPSLGGEKNLFSRLAINGDQVSRMEPAVTAQTPPPARPRNATNAYNRVKIFVDQKGVYQITGQDLIEAGVDIDQINPQTLRLTNKGDDVAILVSGDEDQQFDTSDYFEFWGERNEKTFIDQYPDIYTDPFSDENVYWLSWGGTPGIRMVEESGAIVQTDPTKYNPAIYYSQTVHFEQDGHFDRLGYGNTRRLSYTRDLWFFDSGIQAIGKKTYPVNLVYPDSSSFTPVTVKMKFSGKSQSPHTMMTWLNQRLVGQTSGEWFGQDTFTLNNAGNSNILPVDLRHGQNELEIQMPAIHPDYKSDYIMFNWADITYDRQYKAYHNYIEFTRPSPAVIYYPGNSLFQFDLYNFSRPDIELYKKGISKIVNYNLEVQGSGTPQRYKITFQDDIFSDDIEYIALSSDQKKKPVRIEKDEPFDPENPSVSLRDPSNSASYLIITHQKFYNQAQELLDFRRQQGLHAKMVRVRDIYDAFNDGIKSPLAIKNFLRFVFYNWDRTHRLKYVLFLGDANYNYKAKSGISEDYVPTFFYQTQTFGAVATDLPYALISGDDYLPDLFIGRIPVMTNGEVINVVGKIKQYEQDAPVGPWRNQTLFISGNDRSTFEFGNRVYQRFGIPRKPAFRTQNMRVMNMLLPHHFSAFKLNTVKNKNLPYDPNFGGTTDLIEYFDDGLNFITFLGHGGGAIWADVQLFNLDDVDRLNNQGKYPFIASMTCFTGAFENPSKSGLAQKLVTAPDRGAIGVFASSGLGYVANDYSMLWSLTKNLFQPNTSFGEAVTFGKIDYYITSKYVVSDTIVPGQWWRHYSLKYDMIHQYNLIGDPYLQLKKPQQKLNLQVDNELPLPGDTVNVQVSGPFTSAEGYLELANGESNTVFREPLFCSGGHTGYQVPVPGDSPRGPGFVRAYLAENGTDAAGVQQIGINYSVFDSVQTIPANPNAQDSVSIQLVAKDGLGISGVKVVVVLPKGVVPDDTLHLQTHLVAANTYRTNNKIPPTYSLSTVYYFIYATNTQGQVSRMNYHYDVVETRPDPLIYPGKIRLVGKENVKIGVSVGNSGTVAAQDVELKVYNQQQNFISDQPFATQSVSVDGQDSTTIALDFPFSLEVPSRKIYAMLDRSQNSPDFNRSNNVDSTVIRINRYNVTPALGSTFDKTDNDTIIVANRHKFWADSGAITNSSAVLLQLQDFPVEFAQKGLLPVPLANAGNSGVLKLQILNPQVQFSKPFLLQLWYDRGQVDTSATAIEKLKLYRWDRSRQVWLQQDASLDTADGRLTAHLVKDGLFAPFFTSDHQPPRVELTVEGRRIRSKSLVSPNPVLHILVEDESGLNIDRDNIRVKIDDFNLPPEKLFIPDSVKQSKILGITAYPELEIGKHDLSISVQDVNGNHTSENYTLQVSDQFELHVFGNYPNPFGAAYDYTIFSYYLTKDITDIEIRIFTVSGRLIRRIQNDINTINPSNDPTRQGYNELRWDGRDEDGVEVANGVYFALIVAKNVDEEKQEILKVAKLK